MPSQTSHLGTAKDILMYFLRNPDAVDSLEGVARWRLLDELVRRTVEETDAALTWLVDHGYLRRLESQGTPPTYSLNVDRAAAARRFLRTLCDPPEDAE
jgi:hypothetical protein